MYTDSIATASAVNCVSAAVGCSGRYITIHIPCAGWDRRRRSGPDRPRRCHPDPPAWRRRLGSGRPGAAQSGPATSQYHTDAVPLLTCGPARLRRPPRGILVSCPVRCSATSRRCHSTAMTAAGLTALATSANLAVQHWLAVAMRVVFSRHEQQCHQHPITWPQNLP